MDGFRSLGKFVRQRLKLAPFQKELIGAIYDNPAGTRRVIMGTAFYQVVTLSVDVLSYLFGQHAVRYAERSPQDRK